MEPPSPILEVTSLHRSFGNIHAVNNLTFSLGQGQVVGLIGANGAGKTTLMRMLATLDMPDQGSILIKGINAIDHPREVRHMIGWMPDDFRPYANTTVREYLDFFARAYALPKDRIIPRVNEVVEFTELEELQDRLMDRLSKGQTQRLCLARTLISDPSLLILDEPAAGLDPKARLEFKNLVRILKAQGKTVLISSHILSELGEMCDSLIFMDAGKIVHEGNKDVLLKDENESGWPYEIRLAGEPSALVTWLSLRRDWTLLETLGSGVVARFSQDAPEQIAEELKKMCREFDIYEFHRLERRLEDAFVDILRNQNQPSAAQTGNDNNG